MHPAKAILWRSDRATLMNLNPKLFFYLSVVLCFVLTGCVTAKFKVITDKKLLSESQRVVAEVTCLKATTKHYTTFRDSYLRIGAMPPRVRWSATFRINQILKGEYSGQTIILTDAEDAESAYSHFSFETGKNYTIGFNQASKGKAQHLTVFGQEPNYDWPYVK